MSLDRLHEKLLRGPDRNAAATAVPAQPQPRKRWPGIAVLDAKGNPDFLYGRCIKIDGWLEPAKYGEDRPQQGPVPKTQWIETSSRQPNLKLLFLTDASILPSLKVGDQVKLHLRVMQDPATGQPTGAQWFAEFA